MKKSILAVALILGATTAFAQDLATNKNGKVYLPESGDWGISIDATPFIDLAADLVHIGAAGTKPTPTFNGLNGSNYAISGKYFASNDMAYRGSIRIYNNTQRKSYEQSYDPSFPTATNWPDNVVEKHENYDKSVSRDWSLGFGGGLEWRKGTNRLQGYYGAEAVLAFARSSKSYSYAFDVTAEDGDVATADKLTDYSVDMGGNIDDQGTYITRTLKSKEAMTVAFGVRGFVGVEYFVFPKISVGGEFGWGLGINRTGLSSKTVEGIDYEQNDGTAIDNGTVVSEMSSKSGSKDSQFFVGSDRDNGGTTEKQLWMNSFSPSGAISFNFYF